MDVSTFSSKPSPAVFADRMTAHWTALGNTPSAKLQTLWRTMAGTFNDAADNSRDRKWRVLEPPTGSGKTQGLCVYSALVIEGNRHAAQPLGVLVVTRTIAQAEEIVATIRGLLPDDADHRRAMAKHSENRLNIFQMDGADVLVITHAAYTLALEGLSKDNADRWQALSNWQHGPRRLTIIDEALAGVVEENQVTGDAVRRVLGYIDPELRGQYPAQVMALEKVHDVLNQLQAKWQQLQDTGAKPFSSRIVWRAVHDGRITFPESLSMGPLREAMSSIPYDHKALKKDSPLDRKRIADLVDRTLKDCEAILRRWAYYHRKGKEDTFNSSQLLIPEGLPGPVVLDATATQNFLWELLEDRVEVPSIPQGVRRYDNVRLHIARATGLGKTKMTKLGERRIPRLLANLEETLSSDRKVLLCVHKRVEHIAVGYDHPFAAYSVAHWGAIDGKNDWQDYDTVVVFGLSYRDPVWATNAFFALQGLQDNNWLEKPEWRHYADVRREMQRRQLTVSIIQAVNRVRCRRVVDEEGNCPQTDVFLMLTKDQDGDAILAHLRDEMPGVVVVPWAFKLVGPKESIRRGSSHEALVTFLENRLPGETSMSLIQKELSLSKRALKDLQATLGDADHPLTRALAELGVSYVPGRGRGSRSYLLKR